MTHTINLKTLADFRRVLAEPGIVATLVSHEQIAPDGTTVDRLVRYPSLAARIAGPRAVHSVSSTKVEFLTPAADSGISSLYFGPAGRWSFDGARATLTEYEQVGSYGNRHDDRSKPIGRMIYELSRANG